MASQATKSRSLRTKRPPVTRRRRPPRVKRRSFFPWFWIFLITGALFFLKSLVLETFWVQNADMSPSLERGSYVWVNKLSYGPRLISRPLHIPFTRDRVGGKAFWSYSDLISWPYRRIVTGRPAVYDILVYNDPTVLGIPAELKPPRIGRCIALPGDTIELKGGEVYRNKRLHPYPVLRKYQYTVLAPEPIHPKFFEKYPIAYKVNQEIQANNWQYQLSGLPNDLLPFKILRDIGGVETITRNKFTPEDTDFALFPQHQDVPGNRDYFGPFWVPKQGTRIPLSEYNLQVYGKLIRDFELEDIPGNLELRTDGLYYRGGKMTSHTFKQDYYALSGDNFHIAQDTRLWGFLPESHLLGELGGVLF